MKMSDQRSTGSDTPQRRQRGGLVFSLAVYGLLVSLVMLRMYGTPRAVVEEKKAEAGVLTEERFQERIDDFERKTIKTLEGMFAERERIVEEEKKDEAGVLTEERFQERIDDFERTTIKTLEGVLVERERIVEAPNFYPQSELASQVNKVGEKQSTPIEPEPKEDNPTPISNPTPVQSNSNPVIPNLDQISAESPIFVLSLPNSGNLAMDRYFKCSRLRDSLGRRWKSNRKRESVKIGQCISQNLDNDLPILQDCGDFSVWMEMDHFTNQECFLPGLHPGVLAQLFETYPNATVVNAVKNPTEWYQTLSPMFRRDWPQACQSTHGPGNKFPHKNAGEEAWVSFYNNYHKTLREAAAQYPGVTYQEADLTAEKPSEVGKELEEHLGITPSCWTRRAVGRGLPKDITYPIIVPSLPKSATTTTYQYLNCGLGVGEGRHYQTFDDNGNKLKIGICFHGNILNGRPISENCGDWNHWSDTGTVDLKGDKRCYYPTLEGGLEEFYKEYPYATLLHTLRNPLRWYKSAFNFASMVERWSKHCTDSGFPADPFDESAWVDFYHNHTNLVRDFARDHPTMTYVEMEIEEEEDLLATLRDNFGFLDSCWGHSNQHGNHRL